MNPNLKDNISNELEFRRIKGRKLIVNFEGGRITSDVIAQSPLVAIENEGRSRMKGDREVMAIEK